MMSFFEEIDEDIFKKWYLFKISFFADIMKKKNVHGKYQDRWFFLIS